MICQEAPCVFWIQELRRAYGSAISRPQWLLRRSALSGTDLTWRRFPNNPAPDTSCYEQNISEPWPQEWLENFDLVNQRLTLWNAGSRVADAVTFLTQLVKPGGWVLLIEVELSMNDDNGPFMQDYVHFMRELISAMKTGHTYARQISAILKKARFKDIHERLIDVRFGANNPSEGLAKKGVDTLISALIGLIAAAKGQRLDYHFFWNS